MSVGLYSREVVAAWLGKRVDEIDRMTEDDGLPCVLLPSEKRTRAKFAASQLTDWLNARSKRRWTIHDVIAELDRCVPRAEDPVIERQLEGVNELRGLCEAAASVLRDGKACPRLLGAMAAVVAEIQPKGVAA